MSKITFIALFVFMAMVGNSQQIPTQFEPIKNAVYEDTVVFSWKRLPLSTSYTFQLSADSLFGATLVDVTQANTSYVWAGGAQGRYFWRVKANNTNWSPVRRVFIFNLQQLPGLQFRMKPENNVTLVGELVSEWTDVSGNNVVMSQTTPAQRPTYLPQGLNGKPMIQYAKAGNLTPLTYPTISLPSGNFTFITTYVQTSNVNGAQYLLAGSIRGLICGGSFGAGYNATIYDGANLYRSNPTTAYLNWNVLTMRKNGVRRNGSPLVMTGTQPNTFSLTRVGVDAGTPVNFFIGKMGEMILTNTILNDSLTSLVERYLTTKYTRVVKLPADTEACNTALTLSIQGPATDFQNITWSTGATNVTSLNLTNNGTYWVRGTSWFGEITTDTFSVIGLRPKPIMNIVTNQNICKNRDTLQFFVSNAIPGQVYSWNTGEIGDTIHVTNGSEIYLVQTDPQSSCSFYSDTVQIAHKVTADFSNPATCPGVVAQFLNLSSDIAGDTITSSYWTFGDPSTTTDFSTDTNGVWTYTNSGTYPVYLKVTASDGCADSVVKNITVKPTAVPNFTWQGLCYGKPTQFFDQSTPESGTQVTGYQWNFGPGVNSFFVNPAVVFDTANVYPVTLKIFTASGCNETKILQVPVNKGVNAAFNIPDSLCAKQSINELDQSQGVNDNITNWVWRFGSNTPVTGQNPVFAFQGTGNRVVRLTTTTSAGCVDSVQQTVFVRPTPTANFSFSVNGGNPPFTPQVNNTTVGGNEYLWTIAGSTWSDNAFTPALPTFSDTGTYTLTLTTTNTEGCSDVVSKNIVVFTGDRTLQLISATCTPDGQYMGYTARVFNKGALEVNEITFGASTDYNSVLQEKWTGSLLPGQILDYPLKSSSKVFTAGNFCCVRIDKFNDTLQVQAPDDKICLSLSNSAWVSKAYPTPTQNVVTIDFNFPFADKYTAKLCEIDGKIIQSIFTNQNVSAGYGSFTADISDVKAGMYVIRLYYRDKSYSIKVIKQ